MSLIELPETFVADWRAHYAGTRKRMASVPAKKDSPIVVGKARKSQLREEAKRRQEEEDRQRRERIYRQFREAIEAQMAWKAALAAKYLLERPTKTKITIQDIQQIVCQKCSVSKTELLSARRATAIVRPRQVAMYLAKRMTWLSLPQIGKHFGGRDHTTVLHAVRSIESRRRSDPALNETIEAIEKELAELLCQEVAEG